MNDDWGFGGDMEITHRAPALSPKLETVRELAVTLLEMHRLNGWAVAFDRAATRAGQCRYKEREISLSAKLMQLWTMEQITDTILHEIAHALTPGHGHDAVWQRICLEIGGDPSRTWGHNGEQKIEGRYLGTCPRGHTTRRHRAPKTDRSCGKCSPRFDRRFLLTWKLT
jgi:predicted SprT family Zn-dependent metalloprotease